MKKGASAMTVRMLLNHTSGVAEYSDDPVYVAHILTHPLERFSTEFLLSTIKDAKPMFAPGSKHHYTNTNFELLALIADAITGDHARYIVNRIFVPLNLKHTFYRNDPNYLNNQWLVDSYWDILNTGRPTNITSIQKTNVSSFIGDDGVVATPSDAVKVLKGLAEGKLLSDSSLQQMQQWVKDEEGRPIYGLGLVHYEAGGLVGWGHSGGGIGAGCVLIYVPSKKTFVFMAVNIGTLFGVILPKKQTTQKMRFLEHCCFETKVIGCINSLRFVRSL
jgi:D-alanyl-D-alanine carboxypeptidase